MSDQHPGNGSYRQDQGQEHHDLHDSNGLPFVVDGGKGGAEPTAFCGLYSKRGAFHATLRSNSRATSGRCYSRNLESIMIVTGPSLVSLTTM
jgi:hypothetical protein